MHVWRVRAVRTSVKAIARLNVAHMNDEIEDDQYLAWFTVAANVIVQVRDASIPDSLLYYVNETIAPVHIPTSRQPRRVGCAGGQHKNARARRGMTGREMMVEESI